MQPIDRLLLSRGPHEWYVDPPAVRPLIVATAPGAPLEDRSLNGFVSVQVNVDQWGDNVLGDVANEPSIAVHPTDPNIVVIGWRQFDSVASAFRQAGYAYSHNSGQTWTFPGVLTPGVFRSDPVLEFDAADVNANGLPDECEPDCNGNRIPDAFDIETEISPDSDGDGTPDDCGFVRGDADCDGAINAQDIDAFVLAISEPSAFRNVFPHCERRRRRQRTRHRRLCGEGGQCEPVGRKREAVARAASGGAASRRCEIMCAC